MWRQLIVTYFGDRDSQHNKQNDLWSEMEGPADHLDHLHLLELQPDGDCHLVPCAQGTSLSACASTPRSKH